MHTSERKPDGAAYALERSEAEDSRQALFNDKLRVVHHAMSVSGSKIKQHKILILIDLQGVYLSLQNWLSENGIPIDDGVILACFAQAQIERTGREITSRVTAAQPGSCYNLNELFTSVEIKYIDGKAYLGKELKVAKDATYLNFSLEFEMFYAPAPLQEMEWRLRRAASRGSLVAQSQIKKIKAGVVKRDDVFERNYKAYEDFVSRLKESLLYAGSQEGFFSFYVGNRGLSYFDEKEVDTRIVIRAMDALYKTEADSLCIVSSDQDFMPLHSRADDFGIISYQIDLSKFTEQNRVGAKIKSLQDRFIRCGIDASWPLQVILDAVSAPSMGHFAKYKFTKSELDSLCRLHNKLNEVNLNIIEDSDGNLSLESYRPR